MSRDWAIFRNEKLEPPQETHPPIGVDPSEIDNKSTIMGTNIC